MGGIGKSDRAGLAKLKWKPLGDDDVLGSGWACALLFPDNPSRCLLHWWVHWRVLGALEGSMCPLLI